MVLSGRKRFAQEFQNRREHAGLSQAELARRTGLSQVTISNIERAQSDLQNLKVGTLILLASALNEESSEIIWLVQSCLAEENMNYASPDTRNRPDSTSDPPFSGGTGLEHVLVRHGIHDHGKNWDSEREQSIKETLLQKYYPAFHALNDMSSQIDFLTRFLAPTYTNIGAIDTSDALLTFGEILYERWQAGYRKKHPLFEANIAEWRGWNAQYRGHYTQAITFFKRMLPPSLELGDTFRQATAHHFIGRITYSPQAYRFWFSKLYVSVKKQALPASIHHLQVTDRLHQANQSDTASIYNRLRSGSALASQGDMSQAKQLFQRCLTDFDQVGLISGSLRTRLEFVKLHLYLDENDSSGLRDNLEQLHSILFRLRGLQHPQIVSEVCVSLAYCHYLLADLSRSQKLREQCADYTHLAMRLYPYPEHSLFKIASKLQQMSLIYMTELEKNHYLQTLPSRLADKNDGWYYWLHHFAHTGNPSLTHESKLHYLAYKLGLSVR